MRDSRRWLIAVLAMLIATSAAHATTGSASGNINAGTEENDLGGVFGGAWGDIFVCKSSTCDVTGTPCDDFSDCSGADTACVPLGNGIVVQNPDPPNEFVIVLFDILPVGPGGTMQVSAGFTLNVEQTATTFDVDFTITGQATQGGSTSSGGSVTFFIPPGTTSAVPMLGKRSVIAMVMGLLAVGVFLIVRRMS